MCHSFCHALHFSSLSEEGESRVREWDRESSCKCHSMRRNLLVWKCQVDPSLRNIHSHRRATHKSNYYTDMQRQTLDTSSQEWNPPLKMQSLCHGGRLSIEVMNITPLSHTEKMLKGQFIYMNKWTFCLFLLTLILFRTYMICSRNNKKHLKSSPQDSHPT